MRSLLSLLILISLAVSTDRYGSWLRQKGRLGRFPARFVDSFVDNFDPFNKRTYKQRYYVNENEWNGDINGPIFLEIGAEGETYGPSQGKEEVATLAREHSGIIIALEHRFYGASMPFDDLSWESLLYLDDRQALEDVIHFIDFYDKILHPNDHVDGDPKNKWVLVGGSYSGALASWIRTKYPHMSKCSIASSGVINAIYQFKGFDHQVYYSAGETCGNLMRLVTRLMESELDTTTTKAALFAKFGADPYYDTGDFFYYMADSGVMAIQYGHIDELCVRLQNAYDIGGDLVDAYADYVMNWLNVYMNPNGASTYDRRVMADISIPTNGNMMRQWQYQTCRSLSWFQPAPTLNSIRSQEYLPFSYFIDLCEAVFGRPMDPQTDLVNNYYGGYQSKATNVFYTSYWQDPWHLASPTEQMIDKELNSEATIVHCKDCGHCQDMYAETDSDPAELKEVRQRIKDFVNRCLA